MGVESTALVSSSGFNFRSEAIMCHDVVQMVLIFLYVGILSIFTGFGVPEQYSIAHVLFCKGTIYYYLLCSQLIMSSTTLLLLLLLLMSTLYYLERLILL